MAKPCPMELLREQLLAVLADCSGPEAERMRTRVRRAATMQILWLERSELYQFVSRHLCESRAQLILGVTARHLASTVENI